MIRYIAGLTKGFRMRIALSTWSGLVRVGLGLVFVALSKRAVDIATGNVSGSLRECIIWMVALLCAEQLCTVVGRRSTELSEAGMRNSIQKKLFTRLLTAEWTGKDRFHTGDSLSRLTEDIRIVSECLCRTVPVLLTSLAQFIGAFLFLCWLSPLLAVILTVVFPLFLVAGKAFFRTMRRLTSGIREIESRIQEMMQESLQHRLLLLACRHTVRTVETLAKLHESRLGLIKRRADISGYSWTAVTAGFEFGYLAAFLWGIKGLCEKTISYGTMTAYMQLAGQIQRPLAELSRLLPGLTQTHAAFIRLSEIEDLPTETEGEASPLSLGLIPPGLSFTDVTYSYPGGKPVLSHFSHTFRPGSRTALMGETGSGKSTLLRLALALLQPQEGRVEVFSETESGKVTEPVTPATRGLFVFVPQGNSIMSGTIRENLCLAKHDATESELREALHQAAADFVLDLDRGLDTVCGEHGEGLSEGQAQRIAIARGLLSPGSILLLDEISASLDEETERLLLRRLSSGKNRHTVIFVTHRKAVLPYCDKIVNLS